MDDKWTAAQEELDGEVVEIRDSLNETQIFIKENGVFDAAIDKTAEEIFGTYKTFCATILNVAGKTRAVKETTEDETQQN